MCFFANPRVSYISARVRRLFLQGLINNQLSHVNLGPRSATELGQLAYRLEISFQYNLSSIM